MEKRYNNVGILDTKRRAIFLYHIEPFDRKILLTIRVTKKWEKQNPSVLVVDHRITSNAIIAAGHGMIQLPKGVHVTQIIKMSLQPAVLGFA